MVSKRKLAAENQRIAGDLDATKQTLGMATERLAELELAMEETGWATLGDTSGGITRSDLAVIIARSRVRARDALMKRALGMRGQYVFGQGFEITARDDHTTPIVDRVVGDATHQRVLFGHQAARRAQRARDVDGTVPIAMITDPVTGHTRLRVLPVDQIMEIRTDPDDVATVRWVLRRWTGPDMKPREVVYPGWDWWPDQRPSTVDGTPVRWDTRLWLVTTDDLCAGGFGVPETHAAIEWAVAYRDFLRDFAALVRALSRFAWRARVKPGQVAAAKAKLGTTIGASSGETNPPPLPGSIWVDDGSSDLSPISGKTGATIDVQSGRPLRLMVGAALDLPDTILTGDADQGNRATAKTLDYPTELVMSSIQRVWGEAFTALTTRAIEENAAAPAGQLSGLVTVRDGQRTVDLGDIDATVDVDFPPLTAEPLDTTTRAIAQVAKLDGADPRVLLRVAYQALGVDDVDGLIPDEIDPTGGEDIAAQAEAAALALLDAVSAAGLDADSIRAAAQL